MKLTWFGGTAIRIHIGGRMLVGDPGRAQGVDRTELVSGADGTFALAELTEAAPPLAPLSWQPRHAPTALADETVADPVKLLRLGDAILVDAIGEPPLLLLTSAPPSAGRWSRDAIVVVFGDAALAAAALDLAPRMIVLAAPETVVEAAFHALRDRLGGTALVALEPALALEV